MKKQSVLPFAVVLSIAAIWTMFTQGGKNPLTVNMKPLGKSSTQTTVTATAPSPANPLEDKITALFQSENLSSFIQLHTVDCEERTCTVEAFSPGDPALLKDKVDELVKAHPWLGSWEMKSEAEQPGIVTLLFHPE